MVDNVPAVQSDQGTSTDAMRLQLSQKQLSQTCPPNWLEPKGWLIHLLAGRQGHRHHRNARRRPEARCGLVDEVDRGADRPVVRDRHLRRVVGVRRPEDVEDLGHITDAWGYPIYRLFRIEVPQPAYEGEVTIT